MDGNSQAPQDAEWRFCIDFGTSASKLCIARAPGLQSPSEPQIYPLRVGDFLHGSDTYLAPTVVLFTEDRIRLGQRALNYIAENSETNTPLTSFKRVLGARNIREALEMRLSRSVTSHDYRYKDALVLYIASLLVLAECSLRVESQLEFDINRAVSRYTYPLWRPAVETHRTMLQLFSEANRVAELAGEFLISPFGVSEEMAREVLDEAERSPIDTTIATGIFEAQAAAEAHTLFGAHLPDELMIFDIGAGTTDICAFQRVDKTFTEIKSARRTIPLAGDEVDKVLISMLSERAAKTRLGSQEAELRFWQKVSADSRQLKRELFADGVCSVPFEGTTITVALAELERDPQFKAFIKKLRDVYSSAMRELAARMRKNGTIGVVLAGGGAALPPVHEMVRKTTSKMKFAKAVQMMPLVPSWANHPMFEEKLAPVFPQMAIAIGGAMAEILDHPSGRNSFSPEASAGRSRSA